MAHPTKITCIITSRKKDISSPLMWGNNLSRIDKKVDRVVFHSLPNSRMGTRRTDESDDSGMLRFTPEISEWINCRKILIRLIPALAMFFPFVMGIEPDQRESIERQKDENLMACHLWMHGGKVDYSTKLILVARIASGASDSRFAGLFVLMRDRRDSGIADVYC